MALQKSYFVKSPLNQNSYHLSTFLSLLIFFVGAVQFGQLYGMADQISVPLAAAGFKVHLLAVLIMQFFKTLS